MSRNVEAILLVISGEPGENTAKAWDTETEDKQIPSHIFLSRVRRNPARAAAENVLKALSS